MKKTIAYFLVLVSVIFTQNSFAQSEATVQFLLITPGARATGMGESFVSIADDATATYWNPAGLAFQKQRQISAMHSNWLPQLASDLFFDYLTFVQEIEGLGTFGVAVTYLNLGEQAITSENSPIPTGTFVSSEFAVATSFGTQITENSSVGLQLKYIRSNLAPELSNTSQKGDGSANAFAFDIGYLYKNLLIDRLSFGVNIANMGPKVTYIDKAQADPLPTNLRLGFSYKPIDDEFNRLTVAFEFDKLLVRRYQDENDETKSDPFYKALYSSLFDESMNTELKRVIANVGAEYWYGDMIAMRTGFHHDDIGKVRYLTFGAGLKYASLYIDAAYISPLEQGHPLEDTIQFSLAFNF
ncbi:MAG: type IX secretion system outer membrane channel protein PorV [Deferribacteres bacterium]|nr:type IX secretion system outer membrane channel protein PorV [candidate division KSB1 bacterium]MCB9501537.1 type IX secretion system outer membrane channel protein PorV [Deferribacteres bacterium]